jgi:hypothetical protein
MHSSTFFGFNAKSRKAVCYRTGQLSGSYQLCWAPVTPPQVYVANAKEADPPLYQPSSEVVALFAGMVTHDVDGRKFMNFAKTIIQVPPGVTVNQDHKVSLHWIVSMGVLTWLTWKRCVVLCCVVLCCVVLCWLVGWLVTVGWLVCCSAVLTIGWLVCWLGSRLGWLGRVCDWLFAAVLS